MKLLIKNKIITLFLFSFLSFPSCSSNAQDSVTTWTDEDGVRHFTNTKVDIVDPVESMTVESINLPDIKKYDSDSRTESLKEVAKKTCLNRGGVDCEAGPTEDGNVICGDGFKGSKEKYDGSCKEIRLVSSLEVPNSGKPDKMFLSVPVLAKVRNESRIEATNVRVTASFPESLSSDDRYELLLEGPTTIPPFEIAQYTFTGKLIDVRLARRGTVKVKCSECWDPLKKDAE